MQTAPVLESDGLLHALLLDQQGGAKAIHWEAARSWKPGQEPLWIHLDRKAPFAQEWLREESGLDSVICEALLADETRPRTQVFGSGCVVILRGVNLNPGAAPDDMISVRMWVDEHRVISLRSPRLMALQDVRDELAAGTGPKHPAGVVVAISIRLLVRMHPVLTNLDEVIDSLEEQLMEEPSAELRQQLAQVRRQAITLRRYIGPQRDAVNQLWALGFPWMPDTERSQCRELSDRITRHVEDLDTLRERAAIVQEELASRQAESMNRTMYILSLVAGIFLPLGLLTGLLGINVGGIPGSDNPYGFTIVCLLLAALTALGLLLFRRMRLF
jgi:zinc transporter